MSVIASLAPLRPAVAAGWLTGSRWLAQLRLDRDAAARDLSRIAVVAALQRHNGIAQGARQGHAHYQTRGSNG